MRALRLTHVVIVVIDGTAGLISQDLQIISDATSEGRPVIIAINKIDAIKEDRVKLIEKIHASLEKASINIANPVILEISAKEGKNISAIYKKVINVYEAWNTKVQTSALNQWLKKRVSLHKPPKFKGRDVKLKYITQTKIRPPTFVVFGNTKDIPESYMRYLMNSLSKDFGFNSVPIRFKVETSENPFNKNKD
jgi:GTP-binding protein